MSQHDEKAEVDLIKTIRKAEEAGDHKSQDRLFENLRHLYEDDAKQLAKRFFPRDEISQGNLKGHLLARLDSPVRNYDYETYNSFHLYVMRGWKRYVVREHRRQCRVKGSVVKGLDRAKIMSLDAGISQNEDSPRHGDMVSDPREGQDRSDGIDLFEWLCRQFSVSDPEEQTALRDTIIGEAGPVQRRVGLLILARRIEHRPSISRFWVSRFWADAPTRRMLWKELAQSAQAGD